MAKLASLLFSSAEEIAVLETVVVLEPWRSAPTKCFPFLTLLVGGLIPGWQGLDAFRTGGESGTSIMNGWFKPL